MIKKRAREKESYKVVVLKCKVCPHWMGLDQCPVKVSWLGGLVPVFWSMELDLVSPVGSVMSSSSFRVSMGLIQLWAACLLVCVVFLFC